MRSEVIVNSEEVIIYTHRVTFYCYPCLSPFTSTSALIFPLGTNNI